MAPPEAAGGGGGGRREEGGGGGGGGLGQSITGIIRIAVFWYFASKFFSPKRPSTTDPALLHSNLFHKSEPLVCMYAWLIDCICMIVITNVVLTNKQTNRTCGCMFVRVKNSATLAVKPPWFGTKPIFLTPSGPHTPPDPFSSNTPFPLRYCYLYCYLFIPISNLNRKSQ